MNKLNVVKVLSMVLLVSSSVFGTCFKKVVNLDEDKGHTLVLDYIASDDIEFNLGKYDANAKYGEYKDSGDKSKYPKARLEYSFAGNSCWIDDKPFALLRGIHFDGVKINLADVGKNQKVTSGGPLKGDGGILIWPLKKPNTYVIAFVPNPDNYFWKKPFFVMVDVTNSKSFNFLTDKALADKMVSMDELTNLNKAGVEFGKKYAEDYKKYQLEQVTRLQEQIRQALLDALRQMQGKAYSV